MRGKLGPGTTLGYCTNVHPGTDLGEVKSALAKHALAVKTKVSPNEPMGVGLWFSASVASTLVKEQGQLLEFRDWLGGVGLIPFTLNGFPFGDFHAGSVKQNVYLPHWADEHRSRYTLDLIELLKVLLPESSEGSISTLPIGWPSHIKGSAKRLDGPDIDASIAALSDMVNRLEETSERHGVDLHLNIEPEPLCVASLTEDASQIIDLVRATNGNADRVNHRLRVCHDVCHAAVMYEDPQDVFIKAYAREGVRVGKVQISSGIRAEYNEAELGKKAEVIGALENIAEPRYLHQTALTTRGGQSKMERTRWYSDLPDALESYRAGRDNAEWRVHFHVPVYLDSIGPLGTTNSLIADAVAAAREYHDTKHFEVETYAWGVLPDDLKRETLAEGIADELKWVLDTCGHIT